jgi:ACS family tartrate transporter-like MFS transporter
MIDEGALISQITRRIIPFTFLLYIVSYLDRVNVSFAALQMNTALQFSPDVYAFGAGIFFVGYFLLEIPSNLVLHRVGARVWMARILVTWGLISAGMMFVRGPYSFYMMRFLLGVAEAGFFPGMILYLTYWFPKDQLGRAVARFMTATALAGIIGGPVSGALLNMDKTGGLAGWQWLFLIEGLPAVVLGLVTFIYLPDRPEATTWLTSEEKAWIQARLKKEREEVSTEAHKSLRESMRSGRVWISALTYFAIVMSVYGVTFWLPQIIKTFSGMSDLGVGVVSAIPWLAAAVGMVLISKSSDRSGERRWHVAGSAVVGASGLILAALTRSPSFQLIALAISAVGIWGTLGPFWAMSSRSLSGAGAAAGIALINSVGNLGGFLGPYLVGVIRGRSGNFAASLIALAIFPAIAGVITLMTRDPGSVVAAVYDRRL